MGMVENHMGNPDQYQELLSIIESDYSIKARQGAARRIVQLISHDDFHPADLGTRLNSLYSSISDVRVATELLKARNHLRLRQKSLSPPRRQSPANDLDDPELKAALERLRSLHDADKSQDSVLNARYHIQSLVCEGGMGRIFKALDRSNERPVAIKFLSDIFLGNKNVRQRFEREYRLLSSLKHPGVITVFDYGADERQCYIVMEYVSGGDLAARVTKEDMNLETLLDFFVQVCAALEAVHAKGIVHRDVKPSNILLDDNEGKTIARLTDFGLARDPENDGLTRCDHRIGTMNFSSPEQISDPAAVGPAADIYSLGVTMYYAFSRGQHPAGDYQELEMYRQDVPPEMNRIVAKCIRRKPAERWDSAEQLGEVLKGI